MARHQTRQERAVANLTTFQDVFDERSEVICVAVVSAERNPDTGSVIVARAWSPGKHAPTVCYVDCWAVGTRGGLQPIYSRML